MKPHFRMHVRVLNEEPLIVQRRICWTSVAMGAVVSRCTPWTGSLLWTELRWMLAS